MTTLPGQILRILGTFRAMQDVWVPIDGGYFNVWHRPARDDAITAVMVHGLTSTSRSFLDVVEALPPQVGVIAMDVRGRGLSWEAPPPYDLPHIADDIAVALDHFGIDKAVVAGHSMGGWITALFGARHSDRAHSLVLIDGGLPVPFDTSLSPEELIDAAVGPAIRRLELTFDTPEAYLDWWRAHPSFVGHWAEQMDEIRLYDIHEVDGRWITRINKDAVIRAGADPALDEETLTAWSRLPVPATAVVVERGMLNDPGGFTPLALANECAASNSNIEVAYLEDLNHYTVLHEHGATAIARIITG